MHFAKPTQPDHIDCALTERHEQWLREQYMSWCCENGQAIGVIGVQVCSACRSWSVEISEAFGGVEPALKLHRQYLRDLETLTRIEEQREREAGCFFTAMAAVTQGRANG